jgi:hypothetical protein
MSGGAGDWKAQAKQLLLTCFNKILLNDFYKKVSGNNADGGSAEGLIDGILSRIKTPQDFLRKKEVTVSLLRTYLDLDPKDTTFTGQELKDMVLQRWETSAVPVVEDNNAVLSPTQTSRVKRGRESNATTATAVDGNMNKKKKEEAAPTVRTPLNNWWKVHNCVTGSASCSGVTADGGFIVTPSFPNRDLEANAEVPGEGNVIYILGNHSADGDQIEDTFGPWPTKMSGLNAVHLQFRSLLSESVTEFSTRLGMNVAGSRLDHLSSSMLLFNTLKLINATEVRKAIKKAVDVRPPPLHPIPSPP